MVRLLVGVVVLGLAGAAVGQDVPLAQVLVPGEGWRLVAEKEREAAAERARPATRVALRGGGAIVLRQKDRTLVGEDGKARADLRGLIAPSGLALTPDGGTLYVGDAVGPFLMAFRVDDKGNLSAGERYATVRTRTGQPSGTRALAVDRLGRVYAATAEGVQVLDPTGRLSGVMTSPERAPVTGLALGGAKHDQLHVLCGEKVYARALKREAPKKGKKGK